MNEGNKQVQETSHQGLEIAHLSSVRQGMAENGKRKDELALLVALARGETVADACRQSGVAERTAHRRLENPKFRRDVRSFRGQMLERTVGKLVNVATEAAETLRVLLNAESETVRLGAARAILDHVTRLRESVELDERVQLLETFTMEGPS